MRLLQLFTRSSQVFGSELKRALQLFDPPGLGPLPLARGTATTLRFLEPLAQIGELLTPAAVLVTLLLALVFESLQLLSETREIVWLYFPSKAKGSSSAHAFMISRCASSYLSRVRAGICP